MTETNRSEALVDGDTDDSLGSTLRDRRGPGGVGALSGLLVALASVPFSLVDANAVSFGFGSGWRGWGALCLATLGLLGGALIARWQRVGRVTASLALVGTPLLELQTLVASPAATLTTLVLSTTLLLFIWQVGKMPDRNTPTHVGPSVEAVARGAGLAAIVFWLIWTLHGGQHTLAGALPVGWSIAVSSVAGVVWAVRRRAKRRVRALAIVGAFVVGGVLAILTWGQWWWVTSSFIGTSIASTLLIRRGQRSELAGGWWEPLVGHPERLFVGTFVALCIGGAVLLALPPSAAPGHSVSLVDAVFTSTSAVCVTGLIVLDTPNVFSGFGQVVILLLIQVGGLGIMTFSTAALWALGRRVTLRHEAAVANLISANDRRRVFETAKRILLLTVVSEAIGALVLTRLFYQHGDDLPHALWRGVFTSISAFCNAGFALQTDSLVPYQTSPLVLHVVAALIVLGGLSPLAVFAMPALVMRTAGPVSAQARMVLSAACVLLVVGALCILVFEWDGSLAHLSFADRFHNAWFQSASLRTAGFNSVDFTQLRPVTITLMLLWMFIGGSPGGTAGGVKTTTVATLIASVVQVIRGRSALDLFGRRVSERTRVRASVVVTLAVGSGIAGLVALQLTQSIPTRLAVFEVVSALGTVGLSIGGTALLDDIGKAIIITCMFAGRVGSLSLLMFLSSTRAPPSLGRPEEEIDVG